jgi:hypothetical protein
MEGGCRPESIEPPHIGGGWEGVDVSFSSFLCAKEKDRTFFCFISSSIERLPLTSPSINKLQVF